MAGEFQRLDPIPGEESWGGVPGKDSFNNPRYIVEHVITRKMNEQKRK